MTEDATAFDGIETKDFGPLIEPLLPMVMDEAELLERLARIKGYNEYHVRHGQKHHCVTVKNLQDRIIRWGFGDQAEKLSKQFGHA